VVSVPLVWAEARTGSKTLVNTARTRAAVIGRPSLELVLI
jgi:hypothetical protein